MAKQAAANNMEDEIVDARISCHICERKFDPSRIAKHQLVCTKQNNKAPRKAFKSTIEDRLKGTEFEKFNKQTLAAVTAAAKAAAAAALANMKKPGTANSTNSTTANNNTNVPPTNIPPPPPHKAGAVSKLGAVNVGLIPAPASTTATTNITSPDKESRWRKEHEQLMAVALANKPTSNTGTTPSKSSGNENNFSSSASVQTITASSPNSVHSGTITGASSVTLGESISTNVTPNKLFTENNTNNENIPPVTDGTAPVVKEKPPQIGEKVYLLDKNLTGVLQFKGPVWGLKKGVWYGIEFHDGAHGRNNGSYNGTTYFYCKDNHGIFVRPDRVTKVKDANESTSTATATTAPETTKPAATKESANTSTATTSKPALLSRINSTNKTTDKTETPAPTTKPTARTPPKQAVEAPTPAPTTPPKEKSKIPSPGKITGNVLSSTSSNNVNNKSNTTNNNVTNDTKSNTASKTVPTTTSKIAAPKTTNNNVTSTTSTSRPNSSASTSKPTNGTLTGSTTNNNNANLAAKQKTIATTSNATPVTNAVPTAPSKSVNGNNSENTVTEENNNNSVAFTVGDNKGFSKSLVDKLRKKVEVQRPSTRLVEEVKAKQAAAQQNPPPATVTPVSNTPITNNTDTNQLSQEELRKRDIARNVDYLRVLAGEKSKLAADPGAGKEYIPFGGGGSKLGGDRTNLPTDTGNGIKKKIVTSEGNITIKKGVTDGVNEREKRAAAALARLNSMSKPVTANEGTE